MKKSKFFIFILFVLSAIVFLPDDILNKDLMPLEKVSLPFVGLTKDYTEEDVYDLIHDAFTNLSDEITLSTNITSDQVFNIRDKVIADNPEIFYLDYENSKYWSNGKLEFKYVDTKENIIKKKQRVESRSNYILSKIIKPEMNDFEKELAIHDFIVLNTKYDIKNYENNTIPMSSYNVDGILLDGVGVCEGYAQTFKFLLNKVGIESIVVSEPKINHAWNMVNIDNEYYHVDVTWDDPVPDRRGRVLHTYFNVTDKRMMEGKHIWDKEKYPSCTSEKYSYLWGK